MQLFGKGQLQTMNEPLPICLECLGLPDTPELTGGRFIVGRFPDVRHRPRVPRTVLWKGSLLLENLGEL